MTEQFTKYTRSMTGRPQEPDEQGKGSLTNRFMNQFTDVSEIMLGTDSYREKQRARYRQFTSEKLPEAPERTTREILENKRLAELERQIL